jgi:hypothetical protein
MRPTHYTRTIPTHKFNLVTPQILCYLLSAPQMLSEIVPKYLYTFSSMMVARRCKEFEFENYLFTMTTCKVMLKSLFFVFHLVHNCLIRTELELKCIEVGA